MQCSVCGADGYAFGLCEKHYKRMRKYGDPNGGLQNHGDLAERFWRKVKKTDYCWEWIGGKSSKGYGVIQEGGAGSKSLAAHRLSFELSNGPIPAGLNILHSCDNPRCVNPDHLRAGPQSDNIAEAYEKKRKVSPFAKVENRYQGPRPSLPGAANPNSRLTDDDIRAIRASTEKPGIVAKRFNIIPDYVTMIRKRKVWKHVE